MSQFCTNCGHALGPDGRCPNCGFSVSQGAVPQAPVTPPAQKKKNTGWLRWVILGAAFALFLTGVILALVGLVKTIRSSQQQKSEIAETEESTEETLEDADDREALKEYGRITGEESAKKADLMTEDEAYKAFKARGFSENPITVYYSSDGTYLGTQEIGSGGKDTHPYYQTYYETPYEVVWTITLMGDTFYASPVSWYAEESYEVPHVLSESDRFISFDGNENLFYTMELDDGALIMNSVDRIDSDFLDELDEWEVDEL